MGILSATPAAGQSWREWRRELRCLSPPPPGFLPAVSPQLFCRVQRLSSSRSSSMGRELMRCPQWLWPKSFPGCLCLVRCYRRGQSVPACELPLSLSFFARRGRLRAQQERGGKMVLVVQQKTRQCGPWRRLPFPPRALRRYAAALGVLAGFYPGLLPLAATRGWRLGLVPAESLPPVSSSGTSSASL